MESLSRLNNLKTSQVVKLAALALIALIVLSFVFRIVGTSFGVLFDGAISDSSYPKSVPGYGYDDGEYYEDIDYAIEEAATLSVRNVAGAPIPPRGGYTAGNDAEDFEVTEYYGSIEARDSEGVCRSIADLKVRDDVIFESANESERGCNYTFKVETQQVDEVLAIISAFDPRELSENTYTIKKVVDDYTSQVEILENKLAAINETLANAVAAYDDITVLATRTQDVESLTNIINSKISIIERLTQERINVSTQLERISRAKAEELDRLLYTYFHINVFENKFVDTEGIKDSWKHAVKSFVRDVNQVAQDLTINLVLLLLLILQYALYVFIIVVVLKYGWQIVRRIWKS